MAERFRKQIFVFPGQKNKRDVVVNELLRDWIAVPVENINIEKGESNVIRKQLEGSMNASCQNRCGVEAFGNQTFDIH